MVQVVEVVTTVYQIVGENDTVMRTFNSSEEADAFVQGFQYSQEMDQAKPQEEESLVVEAESLNPVDDEVFEDTEPLENGVIEAL